MPKRRTLRQGMLFSMRLSTSRSASPLWYPTSTRLPRLGAQHVAQIEQTTNAFRRWDNEFGSGMRRKAVVGQLNEAAELLRGPFQEERVARRLFSAVADLAQLAGWMSYDLQLHATAQRYFLLGMHLAKDAGDRPQVGRMLYCLARQMIDLHATGRPSTWRRPACMPSGAALRPRRWRCCTSSRHARTRAWARRVTAPGRSAPPRTPSPRRASDTDPAWCGFFDEGELYGLLGVTLRDLALADTDHASGYAADARQWIDQAIQQRPRNFLRSRVMDIDGLAVVNLLLGEPEAAGQAAATAMTMATAVTSARVMSRLATDGLAGSSTVPGRIRHHGLPGK